jgi:hypothetical protein
VEQTPDLTTGFTDGKAGRELTLDVNTSGYTAGTTGSVNFNLEYVPFSLSEWTGPSSGVFATTSGGKPAWIIRNGVNDEAQNSDTNFATNSVWDGAANGNGAVAFTVQEELILFPDGLTAYKAYYVASYGNDSTGTGESTAPWATVKKARDAIAADYAAAADAWPGKGEDTESYAAIVIPDTVEVPDDTIAIRGSIHPPILLTGDGTLQAKSSIGSNNFLFHISSGARVTLAGGLVLAGFPSPSIKVGGVYVTDSVFTMTGGKISGFSAKQGTGAGVAVYDGTFILSDGEITGNTCSQNGMGVVFVYGDGTFKMSGGEIKANVGNAPAVCLENGTFEMSGGAVRDNKNVDSSTTPRGGGVYVRNGTFTMSAGEIVGNEADFGGGVCVGYAGQFASFTMSGGTVSGNTAWRGGGVYVQGSSSSFEMSGGAVSGNTVSHMSDGKDIGTGGGVYASGTFTMNGGTVGGNTAPGCPGTKEVVAMGDFTMSAGAQVERVFLYNTSDSITIGDSLTGSGTTVVDLGVESGQTITDWVDVQILKPDGAQKSRFTLGQIIRVSSSPYTTVMNIPATYTIGSDGKITQ